MLIFLYVSKSNDKMTICVCGIMCVIAIDETLAGCRIEWYGRRQT